MPLSDKDLEAVDKLPGGDEPSGGGSTIGTGLLPRGGSYKQGLAQSALGLVEAPVQWAERGVQAVAPASVAPYLRVPEAIRAPAREYKREAESTPMGFAGEATGDIGMMFFPGLDVLKGIGYIDKAQTAIKGMSAAQKALLAGGVATMQQPVSGRDFNSEKIQQFFNGALGQTLVQLAGRIPPQALHAIAHTMGVPSWLTRLAQAAHANIAAPVGAAGRALAEKPLVTGAAGGQAPLLSQGRTGAEYGPEE